MKLTQAQLVKILRYDPDTGLFTWLVRAAKQTKVGGLAGYIRQDDGYLRIKFCGRKYPAHHLAFLYMTGCWPSHEIDHRNGIRHDNRWMNLREATVAENKQNRSLRSNNRAGLLGVFWDAKNKKWQAQIATLGKRTFLGRFDDKHAAHAAYIEAKSRLHHFSPKGQQ